MVANTDRLRVTQTAADLSVLNTGTKPVPPLARNLPPGPPKPPKPPTAVGGPAPSDGDDDNARRREQKAAAGRELARRRQEQRDQERQAQLSARRQLAGDARSRIKPTYIPLSKLRPGKINRDIDEALVWKIASEFEWESLQALTVEDNGDDTYTVREGHHRLAALGLVYATEPDKEIPCTVTRPRGDVAAATTVGNINITRKSWTGLGKFNLKVHQQDEIALAVETALIKLGLRPAEKVGRVAQSGDVTGVVAAYDCARIGGIGSVYRTLAVLNGAWGRDPGAFRVGMVKGMWDFLLRYALVAEYRPDVLLKALAATKKVQVIYDSAARKFATAKTAAAVEQRPNAVDERTAISWAIFDAYTAYIKDKTAYKRLPDFGVPATPSAAKDSLNRRIKEYRQWEKRQGQA